MKNLSPAALIWNRACGPISSNALAGDHALAGLLVAHGFTMNGGVLHAVECLSPSSLADAQAGYCYFGFASVALLLSQARRIFETDADLEAQERLLNKQYADLIPADSFLWERFTHHLNANPSDFAPI